MRRPRRAATGAATALAVVVAACAAGRVDRPIGGIEEPSGVARDGNRLLIVGDGDPGVYFSFPVRGDERGLVPLDPARLRRHRLASGRTAFDLEAVGVLADGRIVVLSEREAALFDEQGLVIRYGPDFAEVAGRGPEGLAIQTAPDGASRVAVLWEGGYLDADRLPPALRRDGPPAARRPRVLVHRVAPGARDVQWDVADVERIVELAVPEPAGREPQAQRFRAPDLVWHPIPFEEGEEDGWIVLLSSGWAEPPAPGSIEECDKTEDGKPLRWCHHRLQRFTMDGVPYGAPSDLDEVLPEPLRTANWEGLDWFVPGESLVLVYDEAIADRRVDPQQAFVMPLPEGW